MSGEDFYTGDHTSSIEGGFEGVVSDSTKTPGANDQLIRAAKRQIHLRNKPKKNKSELLDTTSYLAMINAMGIEKLQYPFMKLQIQDHQNGDRGDCKTYSTLVYSTFFAMAETLTWRKWNDISYNKNAANSHGAPSMASEDDDTPFLQAA